LEQYRAARFIGPAQIFLLAGQIAALLLLHRAEMRAGFVTPLAVRMTVLLAWKHGKNTLLSVDQVTESEISWYKI
jgi:hypothetical protein